MKYTLKKSVAEVYQIRLEEPCHTWGDISIRTWKDGGSIDIQSDYGNYAYQWHSIGSSTFKKFLLSVDYGYFMGKCIGSHGERFSNEKTIIEIRKEILRLRREDSLMPDKARELFDSIEDGNDVCNCEGSSELFFERLCNNTDILSDVYCDDFHSVPCEREENYHAKGFWKNIWPAFCEIIKKEEEEKDGDKGKDETV